MSFESILVSISLLYKITVGVILYNISPQAAQLGFHFHRKNSNAAPPQGTCLRTHYCGLKEKIA